MDEIRLDVRSLAPPERHPRIFALFDALGPGGALVLISDHEPRPLRAEFDEKRPGAHQWVQRHVGDGRWEVRLRHAGRGTIGSPVSATLSRCSVFRELDATTLDDLAYHSRRMPVKRGHAIVEQAVNWPYLGIVERGIVQATLATPM